MEDSDYFGDILIPDDETEQDATNDLTFGNTDDIKAGDDISETLWKPNHQSFSSTIQAEKEKFFLAYNPNGTASPPLSPSSYPHAVQAAYDPNTYLSRELATSDSSRTPQTASDAESSPSYLHLLSLFNAAKSADAALRHHPNAPSSSAQQQQQQQPIPLQRAPFGHSQHPPSTPNQQLLRSFGQPGVGPQQPPLPPYTQNSLPLEEYERTMIAFYERQSREALARHESRVAKQLQEALLAQRAGVAFDRNQFDRHQDAARQLIVTDFFNHIQGLRMFMWSRRQQIILQQQQQQQQRHQQSQDQHSEQPQYPLEQLELSKERQNQPSVAHDENLRNDLSRQHQPLHSRQILPGHSKSHLNLEKGEDVGNHRSHGFDLAESILAPLRDELDSEMSLVQMNGLQPSAAKHIPEDSGSLGGLQPNFALLRPRDGRTAVNGRLEDDPRMREIERQMAQAGLGPTSKRSGGRSRKRTFVPLFRNEDYRPALKKSDRRLESMTDRDQELVFRVHLRQLESSAVYKDDYYNTVVSQKEKGGDADVFAGLAETAQTIRLDTKERGVEGLSRSTRKAKRTNVEPNLGTSPTSSDHSNLTFANSLGTVQSWNPRAPRRVMGSGKTELSNPQSKERVSTPMLDDIRVQVRRSIEDGYDTIATIHDICRSESNESLEDQIQLLIATLHLRHDHGDLPFQQRDFWQSTVFFEFMCMAEKGRKYLECVVDLLDLAEMVRFMPALFANLGNMIFSVRVVRDRGGDGRLKLCRRMLSVLRDAEVTGADCLAMLQGFIMTHMLEEKILTCVLRSAVGSRLIYTCIQRIVKDIADGEVVKEDVARLELKPFVRSFISVLANAFNGAASGKCVWEVVASLDGLLPSDSRREYRVDLSRLVGTGTIPTPPQPT